MAATSSSDDHTPVPSPARNAAPRAVVSPTSGRSTGTWSWSACICMSRPFAAPPPSTRSTGARPPGSAAIASELAAKIYKARILKRGIEDDRQNYTRFFLLEPAGSKPRINKSGRGPWKTSLVFSTKNIPGALFRSLSALALRDLNLVKIESRPLRGKPWEYLFYLDLLGKRDEKAVKNALAHLSEVADFLRVLGSYRAAG